MFKRRMSESGSSLDGDKEIRHSTNLKLANEEIARLQKLLHTACCDKMTAELRAEAAERKLDELASNQKEVEEEKKKLRERSVDFSSVESLVITENDEGEKDYLHSQIASLTAQLASAEEKKEELADSLDITQAQCEILAADNNKLIAELESSLAVRKKLNEDIDDLESLVDRLRDNLANGWKEWKSAREYSETMKKDNQKLAGELTEAIKREEEGTEKEMDIDPPTPPSFIPDLNLTSTATVFLPPIVHRPQTINLGLPVGPSYSRFSLMSTTVSPPLMGNGFATHFVPLNNTPSIPPPPIDQIRFFR
ncbi:hypothetical protein PFISCL1PPCAC_6679 [Pristionchus fissidentatus]|uniref:Uncharacterized protein n=1 Tax=Pristionchus fissidentatus TaxID=1538716 RepID=A0AAV5V6Y1_9BILA|nr:hypothetical protein PFISCL1PPCAC_6679 [Pristionchus fissidentatus]